MVIFHSFLYVYQRVITNYLGTGSRRRFGRLHGPSAEKAERVLCFCGAPCQTVEKKTATANTANATQVFICFDVFFKCYFLMF